MTLRYPPSMPAPRRIAIYGGSFNPPHIGHAMVAAWLGWTRRVDAVWLMPTFAHAFGKVLLPFDLRLRACEALAEAVGPWVEANPIESELPVPSYTIDTLRALRERHPQCSFHPVVGADILPDTHRWKDWATIESDFAPIVVGRGGYPSVQGAPTFPEVSSTEIRAALIDEASIDALVPAGVAAVLGAHDAAARLRAQMSAAESRS